MQNPIALLLRPSRAFLLCFGLLAGYGLMMLASFDVDAPVSNDVSDASLVEILR